MKYKFTELRAMIDSTVLNNISSFLYFFILTQGMFSFIIFFHLTGILTQYVRTGRGVHRLMDTDMTADGQILLHGSTVCNTLLNV